MWAWPAYCLTTPNVCNWLKVQLVIISITEIAEAFPRVFLASKK